MYEIAWISEDGFFILLVSHYNIDADNCHCIKADKTAPVLSLFCSVSYLGTGKKGRREGGRGRREGDSGLALKMWTGRRRVRLQSLFYLFNLKKQLFFMVFSNIL